MRPNNAKAVSPMAIDEKPKTSALSRGKGVYRGDVMKRTGIEAINISDS
jgi:hypothetical protein